MKNNFTLAFFSFISIFLYGQTEPIEKIEFEPDPIMMDAYDFATGKMNDVKWMIKATLDDGPRIGFEYKLTNALSVNLESAWLPNYFFAAQDSFQLNTIASMRYYINHKDQIDQGLIGNNLNGVYFEFGSAIRFPASLRIYEGAFVGFGMQSRFLRRGLVDTGVKLQYFGAEGALRLTTGFDLGLAFSKDYNLVEMEENKCAIVRCYDEQFYMLKIPVSRLALFSFSKNLKEIDLRPTLELEHRISRVGLSMNHELRLGFRFQDSKIENVNSFNYRESSYRAAIRWYVGKKKRIIKGKTSNNLSGFYLGPIGEIGIAGGETANTTISNAEFYSVGFNYGYQTRLLRNLYFNVNFGLLAREYYNPNVKGVRTMIETRQESLAISDPNYLVEVLPLFGLIVGYTF